MSAKKIPCDECRERKRRCTYDKPCQRCIKFNIPCVYTIKTSPADEEYLQQIKLLEQVDQLHGQLDSIQQEMVSLQLSSPNPNYSPIIEEVSSPSTTVTTNESISTTSVFSPLPTYTTTTTATTNTTKNRNDTNNNSNNTDTRIIKRQRTQTGLEATLSHEKLNSHWTLTVSKGNFIIHTDITTYAELMDYFYKSVTSVEMNDVVPYSIDDIGTHRKDMISSILQVFVWKRYGKSRYKTITYGFSKTNGNQEGTVIIRKNDASTTLRLLQAYLSCGHLDHLIIHVPTFLKRLVRINVMESPAVLALCAVACTCSCRHVAEILNPLTDISSYGRFYFEQAHDLAMDSFDQPSLEIFATFVLMAFYKLLLQQIDASRRYGDMAERMSMILAEQIKESPEKILFERLEMQLFQILSVTHLSRHRHKAKHQSHSHSHSHSHQDQPPLDRRILNLFHGVSELLQPATDDTEQEKRHIMLKGYVHQLHKECHNTAHQAPSEDTVNYVGIVGHMVEMAMRRWYVALPDSFRLDIPLFDPYQSRRWLLAMESALDVIPFLATLNVYNEYMMMAKAHICKTPDDLEIRESLAAYWRANHGHIDLDYVHAQWGKKWVVRLAKLEDLMKKKMTEKYYKDKMDGISDDIGNGNGNGNYNDNDDDNDDDDDNGDDEGDDEDTRYNQAVISVLLESGYAGFDDPAAHISVTVALNTIQLLQYIRLAYPCQYNQRIALNAWHILLRATRFGFGDQDTKATIHTHLLCCLEMIRDEFNRIPYREILVDYVATMEQELNELFT